MKRNIFIHLLSTLPFIGTLTAKKKRPQIKTFQVTKLKSDGWIHIERVEFQDDLRSKPINVSFELPEKIRKELESQMIDLSRSWKNPPAKDIPSILEKAIKSNIEMYRSL